MEFSELIRKRYSVRKYSDKPVPSGLVDKILMAGNQAPTAVDFQPQRIYVLESKESMERLRSVCQMTFDAPLAFIVCADMHEAAVSKFDGRSFAETDVAIVTDHMMLEAHDVGLGTCWVGYFDRKLIREAFSIPEKEEIFNILIIGYPADGCEPGPLHSKRKTLAETVRIL